ncbi:MAG: hypothetical protein K2K25_12050 [Muribaculaceae bacterium]|nr:hypothetical protein [Muribaculaceae bacterium]
MKKIIIQALVSLVALSANAEYSLKISRGKFPEGVSTQSLNGFKPDSLAYKKVALGQGWAGGDYGKRLNVALSPSFMKTGETCENALTLPMLKIEEGEWLSWEACAVYPIFKETYTVEYRESESDVWVTVGEFKESGNDWKGRLLDLSPCYGKEVEIRFVCRSPKGYMLALSKVAIKPLQPLTFECSNLTPKFFALSELEEGEAIAHFSLTNLGSSVSGIVVGLSIDDEVISQVEENEEWKPGESRIFDLPLPLKLNQRSDYKIILMSDDATNLTLGQSFAYCTSFKRHLLVDKGTGMWCNNCPTGTLAIDELEKEYGDALIGIETHYDDLLADEVNFKWLNFYAIPYMMLNRVRTSAGEGSDKFVDYICRPTEMEIVINTLVENEDGTLTVHATVNTSEDFTDSDRTFRIGYEVTKSFSGNESNMFYQKNICNIASFKQYYYLPSRMLYNLCYFPNVSLPSPLANDTENIAFTGIKYSLPATLEAGSSYECTWDIPMPTGYTNFSGMRVVAYVLDAATQEIVNSVAISVDDYAEVKFQESSNPRPTSNQIYTIDGSKLKVAPQTGIYIQNGKKIIR